MALQVVLLAVALCLGRPCLRLNAHTPPLHADTTLASLEQRNLPQGNCMRAGTPVLDVPPVPGCNQTTASEPWVVAGDLEPGHTPPPWQMQGMAILCGAIALFLPWVARLRTREYDQCDVDRLTGHVRRLMAGVFAQPAPCPEATQLKALAQALNTLDAQLHSQQQIQNVMRHAASHEMRAPLARLEFGLELLRRRQHDTGNAINELLADVSDLGALTADSAEYSQFAMMPQLEPECFDVRDTLAALPMQLVGTGSPLVILPVLQPVVMCGHRPAITLALRNLITNALRHAHEHVEVTLWHEQGHVHVQVDDDGPGIPAEHRQRVFEPYVRLASGANGSGLGLAMVRTIVEKHGGLLSVGESVLGGARIRLQLPDRQA